MPDINTFVTLVTWLGQPAETFLTEEAGTAGAGSLDAAFLPLLARQKVTPETHKSFIGE